MGSRPHIARSSCDDNQAMESSLADRIAAGTYRVDADRVAAAMIARMAGSRPSAVLVAPQALDCTPVRADKAQARAPVRDA
jgi:hypothetical protein